MNQEQFFPNFQLFARRTNIFSEENLNELANAYLISENDLKHETPLAKHLLS